MGVSLQSLQVASYIDRLPKAVKVKVRMTMMVIVHKLQALAAKHVRATTRRVFDVVCCGSRMCV